MAKAKQVKCVFGSKHANQVLGMGQNMVIEFHNFRYEATDQKEIDMLKKACKHSDPVSKIVLLEEIDLTPKEENSGGDKTGE